VGESADAGGDSDPWRRRRLHLRAQTQGGVKGMDPWQRDFVNPSGDCSSEPQMQVVVRSRHWRSASAFESRIRGSCMCGPQLHGDSPTPHIGFKHLKGGNVHSQV
jgi:hypothetical protein